MPELGKLVAVFEADTKHFDAGVRNVATKVTQMTTTMQGLTGGVSSATATLSSMAGPLSLIAGGAVVAASAIGGLAVGLFELVKSSAKVGGELFDLSQKTSFAVETLSGLSIIAKTTGSDIQAISSSLVIFQKNMGAASEAGSKQSGVFKALNIDINDQEKALRQAFVALNKYGDGQKGVDAATKLFGKSGAAVLAMVKETNGNLDEAIKRYQQMGLVITDDAAKASDKFNDVLEETELQIAAVTRSIGMELLPIATEALQGISKSLAENQDAWRSWGTTISDVIRGTMVFARSELGQTLAAVSGFIVRWGSLAGLVTQGLGALGAANRPGPSTAADKVGGMTDLLLGPVRRGSTGPSFRGGGGGRAKRKDVPNVQGLPDPGNLDDMIAGLQELQPLLDVIRFATKDWAAALEDVGKASDELFSKGGGGVSLLKGAGEEIDAGVGKRDRGEGIQALKDQIEFMRQQSQQLGSELTDIFHNSIADGFNAGVKEGLATLALGLIDIVQNVFLNRIAEGLGQIFSNASTGGGGGGFWSGLLKTVLGAAIGGAAGGIGGGGFTKGGTFSGAAGGSAGKFAGGFAGGGTIPMGQYGIVHDNERVYATPGGARVVPGGGGGSGTVQNITINLPPDRGGYTSPKSRRQLASDLVGALRGAQS